MSLLKWFREWRNRPNNVITRNAEAICRLARRIEESDAQMKREYLAVEANCSGRIAPIDEFFSEMQQTAASDDIDLDSLLTQASRAFTDGEDRRSLTREQAEQIAYTELRNYPPTGKPGLF